MRLAAPVSYFLLAALEWAPQVPGPAPGEAPPLLRGPGPTIEATLAEPQVARSGDHTSCARRSR